MNKKNLKRSWHLNLLILFISVFSAFIIGEILIRSYEWFNKEDNVNEQLEWIPTYEFSETRHHRLIPNIRSRHTGIEFDYIWENNSLGMRDRPRSAQKPPGNFRLLFLGDSMVQGWGVALEHSMVSILEQKFNQLKREKTIEVLNAGVFGYSPFLEFIYLKELTPIVEPDMVLVGFFLGNDVGDDFFYFNEAKKISNSDFMFEDNDLWPWSELDSLTSARMNDENKIVDPEVGSENSNFFSEFWRIAEPILNKSRIIYLIKNFLENMKERQLIEEHKIIAEHVVKNYENDIKVNLGLINFPILTKEKRAELWQITLKSLESINRYLNNIDIPVVLIVIPAGSPPNFNEPFEIIDEFTEKISLPVIYLDEESLNHSELANYPFDGHWNEEGNRLAAEIIYKKLQDIDLLPNQINIKN